MAAIAVCAASALALEPPAAFAATDPIAAVDNLSTFIFGLIRSVGLILLGFGVVQVGMSLKSHDLPARQRLPDPGGRRGHHVREGKSWISSSDRPVARAPKGGGPLDSDNWVVSNLQGALDTWNEKMGEIVGLLTASPADFRGGGIWDAVLSIHGAVQAVALALLVLFFLSGLVKTCGSFAEDQAPEVVLKLFVRFVLAHAAVVYGLELMMAFLDVVQGAHRRHDGCCGGFASAAPAALPGEMVEAIEDVGFLDAIPLWAVTLLGGLLVTVLSFIMILAVYGRFFKIYMYTALAPIPCPPSRASRVSRSARRSSKATGPCASRVRSSCSHASYSRCSHRRRRWWMPRLRGHQVWSYVGGLPSTCWCSRAWSRWPTAWCAR